MIYHFKNLRRTKIREILFRGKRADNGEWIEGYYVSVGETHGYILTGKLRFENGYAVYERFKVIPETVGQYTGLTDKNGKKIFTGDIVQYQTYDDFICTSVVKLGEYKQDGSGGEYNGTDCIGYYVEVIKFICPDWCNDDLDFFHEYLKTQNILEVAKKCKVIGNIHDNPELLEVSE